MKNLKNLKGTKVLSKLELQAIKGGCTFDYECGRFAVCLNGQCAFAEM